MFQGHRLVIFIGTPRSPHIAEITRTTRTSLGLDLEVQGSTSIVLDTGTLLGICTPECNQQPDKTSAFIEVNDQLIKSINELSQFDQQHLPS